MRFAMRRMRTAFRLSEFLRSIMSSPPTGTVTFLFTDIEGSTTLAQQHPAEWESARQRHHAILREAIEAQHGYVFQVVGDAFCVAFATAPEALAAALAGQHALQAESWGITPIRVRMGLHTGAAEARDGDYLGYLTLAQVQRVMSAAYGGQTLLSNASAGLLSAQLPIDVTLRDLGEHCLKGLLNPEHIWQVVAPSMRSDFPALISLNSIPNNLPVQLTSFIGRDKEIIEAKRLLAETHLLTLTGAGGTGKTRLSLQVAAELIDNFRDGVWFVELAPVSDPALVAPTIAHVLRLSDSPGTPLIEVLKDYLRGKEILLVLDNFEQLVDAAPFVKTLLTTAPKLKALISSRTILRIAGEREYAVPLLAFPDPKHLPPLEQLTQYEAVRLFIERARTVKSDFSVSNESAPAIAEVCYRLDGLPLAIELAAARVRLLPPQKMLAQLTNKLKFLISSARDLPARQQTLRGAIDWSFELLAPAEQALFRRLAVFLGGATLEAIEAVCNADSIISVFDGIESLVDKSLLKQKEHGAEPRFMMLEMIREYAREKLVEAGELESMRDRHLRYFLDLSEQSGPALSSLGHMASLAALGLNVLEGEDDNLSAALAWGLEHDPDLSLRLAGALGGYWMVSGHLTEGRRWLRESLARVDAAPPVAGEAGGARQNTRALALAEAGTLATVQGDVRTARPLLEEAVSLLRRLDDRPRLGLTLTMLGLTTFFLDDIPVARAVLEEGAELGRAVNNKSDLALALTFLGQVIFRSSKDYAAARPYFEEAVKLGQEIGNGDRAADIWNNWGLAAYQAGEYEEARRCFLASMTIHERLPGGQFQNISRSGLADVAWRLGDYDQAEALNGEVLTEWQRLGNRGAMARILECLAFVAKDRAQVEAGDQSLALFRRAAILLGAADMLRMSSGNPMTGAEHDEYEREIAGVRSALDPAVFDSARADGRGLTLEQAVALALLRT
jgi:predicted ATPase/class 3 adenylate cyclase/Tfp pilus assembly protein PilF